MLIKYLTLINILSVPILNLSIHFAFYFCFFRILTFRNWIINEAKMRERLSTNLGMLKQNTTHAYIKLLFITIKKSCLEKKERNSYDIYL